MYKVLICGHFGYGKDFFDGQTVKTKILTEELKCQLGKEFVTTIDTMNLTKKPLEFLYLSFKMFKNSENIIMLPAQRGVKILTPLFLIFNIFFKRKLYYVVIGGWLPELLKNNWWLKKMLLNFTGIYVETKMMKDLLAMRNVFVLPNFKKITVLDEKDLIYTDNEPFKLCTFSRVMKEKGIEDAINIVKKINELAKRNMVTLDIYGQINGNYKKEFEIMERDFPEFISYKGEVDFTRSTEVLKKYFLLLFPTFYDGEGFPGTIIDAFSSGLPVVASNWKYNSEIIDENKTGYLYKDMEEFKTIIQKLCDNPMIVRKLKFNCIEKVKEYDSERLVRQLIVDMNIKNVIE